MSDVLAQRRVTEENHHRFAEFSGDLNPLHVDREAAKNMPPGQRLAYGMDLLLWSLEALAKQDKLPLQVSRVRARFLKWVFLQDEVQLRQSASSSGNVYELVVNGSVVATFDLHANERSISSAFDCSAVSASRRIEPLPLLLHELEGRAGLVHLADASKAKALFPKLAEEFGAQIVSECATCSYIIGMEAPGLYSMSMKYDLQFHTTTQTAKCMQYKVVSVDERFRKIRIAVNGSAISATLEAMVREP